MKKLLFAALLAVTIGSGAFAAENENVSSQVRRSFNIEFKEASNVSWTATNEFVKATFILDNQKMEAFYNTDGEIIGTSKSTSIDALPVAAKRNFTKKFGDYTVKEAIRFEGAKESAYFISAENDRQSVIVKVDYFNHVSTIKSTKK